MFDELNTDDQEVGKEKTEDQETDGQNTSNGKAFLAFMAILVPLYFVVNHFWGGDRALTPYMCCATNMVAVGMCWDLSNRLWFWGVAVLLMACHLPLVLLVHWPHYWIPGIALLPIGLVDVLILVKVIRFVEKFVPKSHSRDTQA